LQASSRSLRQWLLMALSDLIHATEWRGISIAKTMRQFPAY
jgi:hypothetical protein